MKLYLFDMGAKIYGDCILAVEGERSILIDGAHPGDWQASEATPSIPEQLSKVLGKPPFKIDLLVVTHCHSDHIGCLPKMVQDGTVEFDMALVADESLGFPTDGEDAALDAESAKVVAAMCEEPQPQIGGAELDAFLTDAAKLADSYSAMLAKLKRNGTKITRYTGPSAKVKQIETQFSSFGLSILGPTNDHLIVCRDELARLKKKVRKAVDGIRRSDATMGASQIYRALLSNTAPPSIGLTDDLREYLDMVGPGAALNDQKHCSHTWNAGPEDSSDRRHAVGGSGGARSRRVDVRAAQGHQGRGPVSVRQAPASRFVQWIQPDRLGRVRECAGVRDIDRERGSQTSGHRCVEISREHRRQIPLGAHRPERTHRGIVSQRQAECQRRRR